MKLTLVLALVCLAALVSGYAVPEKERKVLADKEFLSRQKQILRLFVRIQQPTLYQDLIEISKSYSIEENIDKYARRTRGVLNLTMKLAPKLESLKTNMCMRTRVGRTEEVEQAEANKHSRGEMREHHNVTSRVKRACVCPQFPKEVKKFLYLYKAGFFLPRSDIFVPLEKEHSEQAKRLSELFYDAKDYDTFFKTAVWARNHLNGGVFLYSFTRSLQAREDTRFFYIPPYYEIYPFLFVDEHVIQNVYEARLTSTYSNIGYFPRLRFNNGQSVTGRQQYSTFYDTEAISVQDVKETVSRLRQAVESGYIFNEQGEKISLFETDGRNMLGELINFYGNSPNKHYYGSYFTEALYVTGHVADPQQQYGLAPSALLNYETALRDHSVLQYGEEVIRECGLQIRGQAAQLAPSALLNYETALRDPLYYSLVKKLFESVVYKYVAKQPKYTYETLAFPGIKVQGVEVDPLITYFDDFEINLDNVVSVNDPKDGEHVDFRVKQGRLNHKPFNYKVSVESDKETDVMIKVFITPKYDSYGREFDLDTKIFYSVELDRFPAKDMSSCLWRTFSTNVLGRTAMRYVVLYSIDEINLDNVVSVNDPKDGEHVDFRVKQGRLNHKPFDYKVSVESDKETDVMIKVFISPKYDSYGREFDLDTKMFYAVELDRFPAKVNVGTTVIERNSLNSSVAVPDAPSFRYILNKVDAAIENKEDYFIDKVGDFFFTFMNSPATTVSLRGILIPKGRKDGFPVEFAVVVLPFDQADKDDLWKYDMGSVTLLGAPANFKYPDSRPIDFPLDRPYRSAYDVFTPNTFVKTVSIFHKNLEEINTV
uniref:Hexamerin n=1 Tax=Timema poppense TaxID=170557 RepID=A0A7R9DK55_TIMPO|nr:unnamed protein product [Timema poppensis]